jgi:hypothetical protein
MKTIISKCTPKIIVLFTLTALSCTKYETPGNQAPETDPVCDPVAVSTCDPDTVYSQNTILPLVVAMTRPRIKMV